MKADKQKTVLGIDPGFARLGWGIVKGKKDKLVVHEYGCIKTDKKLLFVQRLDLIFQEIKKIIQKTKPDFIAIEQLFFFKNLKTAIDVSQARGVILLAAYQSKIPIKEFTPLEVKQAVCGYGRADKQQVQKMIKITLGLKKIPSSDDVADALAIAVCGLITKSNL